MSWVSLLTAILAIARALTSWLQERQLLDAGAAQATLKGIQDADAAIAKASRARADARADNQRDPSGVLTKDDGFKRPD